MIPQITKNRLLIRKPEILVIVRLQTANVSRGRLGPFF